VDNPVFKDRDPPSLKKDSVPCYPLNDFVALSPCRRYAETELRLTSLIKAAADSTIIPKFLVIMNAPTPPMVSLDSAEAAEMMGLVRSEFEYLLALEKQGKNNRGRPVPRHSRGVRHPRCGERG